MKRLLPLVLLLALSCASARPRPIAIPLETLDDRLLLVHVRVNGSRPLTFIVDTGADDGDIINRDLLPELGLHEGARQSIANPGGAVQMAPVTDVTLQVGPLLLHGETLLTAPLSQFAPLLGRPVDGILGQAFLSRFAVRFDYVGRRMILNDGNRTGVRLPLIVTNGMPFIDVAVSNHGRTAPARVEIDTGSFEALGSNSRYVATAGLLNPGDARFEETGVAMGGETEAFRVRVDALKVGPFELRRPAIAATTEEGGYQSSVKSAGVLGAEALRRFDLLIDYPNAAVYISPNAHFGDAWIEDVTGMRVLATPPDFRKKTIGDVFRHSPADEAGIRPGDELITIDGRPVADRSVEQIMATFRRSVSRRLSLMRNGAKIAPTLRPHPMT